MACLSPANHYNPDLGTIDIAGFTTETSAKYHNIAVNPDVSFVVDDSIGEGAEGQRFVEVRGFAEQAEAGSSARIIRIRLRRVVSWNIGEGPARFQASASLIRVPMIQRHI